jgi:hypothetical protein
MEMTDMVFAYFSPEMTLPLASVLAATFGFIMLVGRAPFRLAARSWRYLVQKFKP